MTKTDRAAAIAHAETLDAKVAALQAEINRLQSKLSDLKWDRARAWDRADGVVLCDEPRDMGYLLDYPVQKD